MGIEDEENIDKLFKRLEDHEIVPDTSQMDEMRIRLEGEKFYHFGWKHFNIYHTIVIGLCTSLSLWSFTDRLIENAQERKSIVIIDTVYVRDTMLSVHTINTDAISDEKPRALSNSKKGDRVMQTLTQKPSTKKNQDSLQTSNAFETSNKAEATPVTLPQKKEKPDSIHLTKRALPKKIIYITKRDTVVKYDTTKVVRKK